MVKLTWILRTVKRAQPPKQSDLFSTTLKELYKTKVFPLEVKTSFHHFHSPPMEDGDFEAKPSVMLIGQYSTGKTTFIKYLLKSNFPGMRIGPEPTTDKFISVEYDDNSKVIPGNALVVDSKRQFKPLTKFGNNFLNKFQCSTVTCDVLRHLSLVDTPGILSGEKQRVERGYDFVGVLKWFAERVDRILLLFDANKLDISDEFKRCIESLQGHDDKIRIVLNKSDMVDHQELIRVYGALMWSLGKILNTPEVSRVYVGSFWDQPLRCNDCKRLFEIEQQDLLDDLMSLPKHSTVRKLNDFIKRVRLVKVHAHIMNSLEGDMPLVFGKNSVKEHLIDTLQKTFTKIQEVHGVSYGDLPDCSKMQQQLWSFDFKKLNNVNKRLLDEIDVLLEKDVSKIMDVITDMPAPDEEDVSGGVFESLKEDNFGFTKDEGVNAGFGEVEWIVNKQREKYDRVFNELKNSDSDKVHFRVVKSEMIKSQLPNSVLTQIWKLSDIDQDGCFNIDEFALAMYLIELKLNGHELPSTLPEHLYPPRRQSTV